MILQALNDLHSRLIAEEKTYKIAPDGFSVQKITFLVVLDPGSETWSIMDFQDRSGKKPRSKTLLVPGKGKPPGSGITPCFLWDNTGYLLGYKKDDPKPERSVETFEASRAYHLGLEKEISDDGFSLLCRCFENWSPEQASEYPDLNEVATGFGIFQIRGETEFLHNRAPIQKWWSNQMESSETAAEMGICLITGELRPIAELHEPKIKGVKDAQGAGALIVSYNADAYESFGKKSGMNGPVSEGAAQRYSKSLNALLATDKHRIQVGDATTVFWTEKPTASEDCLKQWFEGAAEKDQSAQDKALLQSMENAVRRLSEGGSPENILEDDPKTRFFILGLTGQAGGRIGVRFWHQSTLGEFMEKLAQHHADLKIERQWGDGAKRPDPEFPKIWQLLRQTGRESKDVPPNLAGTLMRSILDGTPYPQLLANAVVNRIRADREINYLRAAILKGWLTRLPNAKHTIPMTYDKTKPDPSYRLGALFAVLEKTQQDALGDINAGIRDRFYASASATPASVFPRLLRTYQHHLSKASSQNKGYQIYREREVQSILAEPEPLPEFPSHLNLRDQGLFAIGFYHKRTDLWRKKDSPESKEPDPETTN